MTLEVHTQMEMSKNETIHTTFLELQMCSEINNELEKNNNMENNRITREARGTY